MSDVYSSFERDHFTRKSKKRQQDFKSNKKSCRGYKVYEPKSSEKQQLKDQECPNTQKSTQQSHDDYQDYENYEDFNEYDDYDSKNSRNDNSDNYHLKSYNRQEKKATASSGKYTVWKKEIIKVNKDSILKSHEATPVNKNIDGLVHENSNLFVKEKQPPVNKTISEPSSDEADKQHLDHKSSGDSVASASTNVTNDDRTPMETLDYAQNTPESVKRMIVLQLNLLNSLAVVKKSGGAQFKGKNPTKDQNSAKNREQGQKENKGSSKSKDCRDEIQISESLSDKTELNEDILVKNIGRIGKDGEGKNEKGCEETDESEGERYSNIDLVIERKLLNNEVGSNSDVFDEAGNDLSKIILNLELIKLEKEEMDAFEDNERPLWEDLDTKQALEDIKKQGFTFTTSPQNLKASFINSQYKGKTKLAEFFGDNEDNDDDFDHIFSAREFGKSFYRPSVDTNFKETTTANGDLSSTILSPNSKTNRGLETSMSASSCSHISFLQQYLEKQGNFNFSQNTSGIQTNGYNQGAKQMSVLFEDQGAAPPGFDKPKFVFKYCGHNYEAKVWFYTDERNLIQGPFSARQMDEWYTNNQLQSELSISKGMGNNSNFKPLSHFVERAIQKEIRNLSYDNDCIYYPNPIESGSPVLKVDIDPSYQEAQDILAAVDQYNLNAAQEMLTSHNIREMFIEDPVIESDTSLSAQLFAPGRPRQSRRLAAFDNCNSRPDLDEEQNYDSQKENLNLPVECGKLTIGDEVSNCQNIEGKETSPLSASHTPEDNLVASTKLAANDSSAPVLDGVSALKTSSPLNSHIEQSSTPLTSSVQDKLNVEQASVPDYRVQPLSATQIQLLQNFSWQAFASEGVKNAEACLVKNE